MKKKTPLTIFLKGFYQQGTVTILPAQASFQSSAFVQANCWIELAEEISSFNKGATVNIYPFI